MSYGRCKINEICYYDDGNVMCGLKFCFVEELKYFFFLYRVMVFFVYCFDFLFICFNGVLDECI